MAIDRESSLRKAEKLLRQGRLDGAIEEYLRLIEDQPNDWNSINALGDLYYRAGEVDLAIAQYTRIADHFAREGFLPKALALYRKVLKVRPDEEHALLQAAEIAVRQGLLADAKTGLTSVAEKRLRRGDRRGAAEIRVRLAVLDPNDTNARVAAARASVELGDTAAALARFKESATDLLDRGRPSEALALLEEAVTLDPGDVEVRTRLVSAYLVAGDIVRARSYATSSHQLKAVAAELASRGHDDEALEVLAEVVAAEPADGETRRQLVRSYIARGDNTRAASFLPDAPSDDEQEVLLFVEIRLRAGQLDEGRAVLERFLERSPNSRDTVVLLGCSLADAHVDAAFVCLDVASESAVRAADWPEAAAALHEFITRVPRHIPALSKLVEVCVDGGLEATMVAAQAQLADAYLEDGRAAEARVIAEDLVAREPWERSNIERFRRALDMMGEPDPDAVIATRLSGEAPFMSTDLSLDEPGPRDGGQHEGGEQAAAREDTQAEAALDAVADPLPSLDDGSGGEAPGAAVPAAAASPTRRDAVSRPAAAEDMYTLGPGAIDLREILGENFDDPPPAPASTEVVEIDLSTALGDIEAQSPAPTSTPTPPARPKGARLDEVFDEFRREVAREQAQDAAEQHFKVAVTYRDMGMTDEAIEAYALAARSPRHRFEAASAIARLERGRGRLKEAIEWFERAADAPASSREAGRDLLYDLGVALEELGEDVRALAVFLEVQADTADYRDVTDRLSRLSDLQTGE